MSASATAPVNSYDRVPYKSFPFPQTHPDRLATIGALFGLRPAALETCRVLELGCASGGNLLPMADQFPEASFLGIDASARQIEAGQELLTHSGLRNVELRCQDILKFTSETPFDYIICHGVYSWVPDAVQQQILEICRRHLAPQGIAYVSYNTYPGWHMRGMIRDIMRYRAAAFAEPRQQLSQARGLLAFLSNSVKGENNPYGLLLRQELETISKADDYYLLHEHLEDVNEPLYFHQFAERAAAAQLQYLGEADFGVMSVENFPEQVRGMLLSVARDAIETEQYMDFLRNRAFRQTLLCRAELEVERKARPQRLLGLRVASSAQPEESADGKGSKASTKFRRGNSVLTTSDPVVKAAMQHLRQAWPASLPFAELASLARSSATGQPAAVDRDVMSSATEALAETLIRCFATATVDLRTTAPRFTTTVSECPCAAQLARTQATRGTNVTNRLHESVTLDDLQRQVLSHCDGNHTRDQLIEQLASSITSGDLILHHAGERITDPATTKKLAAEAVPSILAGLTQRALIIG